MRRDETGYIVVETIASFLLFVFLILSIISLINIVVVQARIHYALTQAANTLSMYVYVLDVTGVADPMMKSAEMGEMMHQEISEFRTNAIGVLNGIQSLSPETGKHGQAVKDQVTNWAEDIASDPKGAVQTVLNYGIQRGGNEVFEKLVRPLVGRYLANGAQSGDAYLKAFRVIDGLDGLCFVDSGFESTLLNSKGEVRLQVEYDIDYTFGALMLPFQEPKLHVTQEVVTKAWLDGKGEGYEKP